MKPKDPGLLHQGAAAFFDAESIPGALCGRLGYAFADLSLLRLALTHPSVHPQKNNQRLEFLGDAVLQLAISRALFEKSREDEGKLTFRRQRLVNEQALARVARSLELGEALRLETSFRQDGGAKLDSVLADAMEAVLAAIYLDGGIEKAQEVILRLWEPLIESADAALDSRGALQAFLQKAGRGLPEYVEAGVKGPAHRRVFTVALNVEGHELARGSGGTKRAAMQQAAEIALKLLMNGEGLNEAEQA